MHLKFLPHGKGSARAAVDYLVGERDAGGHRREGVEVAARESGRGGSRSRFA